MVRVRILPGVLKKYLKKTYIHEKSLKTNPQDDFYNLQLLLYAGSRQITKILYNTSITPHQVILISMVFGILGSVMMVNSEFYVILTGSVLLFFKNILDKVDGSLARAKGMDSRKGRFYDSISDFVVTLSMFSAIAYELYQKYENLTVVLIAFIAMIFSMLQCSYFIFYQVSFIIITGKKTVNRLIERVTEHDLISLDKWTIFLQKVFQIIYGWQDLLFYKLDGILLGKLSKNSKCRDDVIRGIWYKNKLFLTMASSLSIGTHIFLICICSLMRNFELYLFMNLIIMNLLLILSVFYHYKSTFRKINDLSDKKI
ncbi:MAG: CDP-alcohol phosphatidyltransferase family protein [Ignavibacteria bacterium]|nr:CDP-alcohol phosphatidyltransferase family protein [Ignavibacteria bacterium]